MRMTNIAVPFIALLALIAADRMFHPHRRPAVRMVCGAAARAPMHRTSYRPYTSVVRPSPHERRWLHRDANQRD